MNIGPRSDGTIPDEVQQVLLAVGGWLKVNGDAMYGTRQWKVYGEGPTKVAVGSFHDTETHHTPQRTSVSLRKAPSSSRSNLSGHPAERQSYDRLEPHICRGVSSPSLCLARTRSSPISNGLTDCISIFRLSP